MQFLTIAYGEPAAYDRTAPEIRNAAHDHDARLEQNGKIVAGGMAGTPVQVRNHNAAGIRTVTGPYLQTDLPVAGYAILEAESLDEAIELAASFSVRGHRGRDRGLAGRPREHSRLADVRAAATEFTFVSKTHSELYSLHDRA